MINLAVKTFNPISDFYCMYIILLSRPTKREHSFISEESFTCHCRRHRRQLSHLHWSPRSRPVCPSCYPSSFRSSLTHCFLPSLSLSLSLSLFLLSPILSVYPPLTAGELWRPARLPERPAAVVLGVRLLPHGDNVDRRVRRHCVRHLAGQGLPSHVPPRRTRKYRHRKSWVN